jgi:hypothetical protein
MAIQKGNISVVNIGEDGNDNFLGTYPTLLALQTEYPVAESGNFAFVDEVGSDILQYIWDATENIWVIGGTVSGVITVNGYTQPIITLNADDIGDAATSNKFVTAGDLQKLGFITITSALNLNTMNSAIGTNATNIGLNATAITNLNNGKITKPVAPTFEKDILSRSPVAGDYVSLTPKNGVVKLNNVITNTVILDGTKFKIINQLGSTFSSVTSFPKNISNQYPAQDPINNYATFIPELYNSVDGKWLENPIDKQLHLWRVNVDYTKGGVQTNRELIFELFNSVSGFREQLAFTMPSGQAFQTFEYFFLLGTVADSNSIGEGYEFFITPNGDDVTINDLSISRFSYEKI